jgi:nitroreductase
VSTDPNQPSGSSTTPATSVSEALLTRQSARAFLPTPVPLATVTELLDLARWAPSGSNIQPWRVHALTGAPLQAMVDETLAIAMAGQSPEQEYLYYASPLPEPYLSRRRANGWGLYGHLGIGKGDRAASAYLGFLSIVDQIPDVQQLKDDPDSFKIPEDPGMQFALVSACLAMGNRGVRDAALAVHAGMHLHRETASGTVPTAVHCGERWGR